ncbi:MAG: prepilin-type N-terminal cleavage/methylation domain-containing protein [Gammaproteobacteria bacterium]|nr:prepilin-type N-terminal cleavage/methylation domain-containing protein [Gammaproteobacteria bacterium]
MDFSKQLSGGFTLLELIVVVAVLSILLGVVIPGFKSMLEQNRMAAAVNGFIATLRYARSEAVTRETRVVVCASTDGVNCLDDYTGWGEGTLVFVDSDNSRSRDVDELLLNYRQGVEDGLEVMSSSSSRSTITYYPTGRGWGSNTTVRFCLPGSDIENRAVIISFTGNPRVSHKMPGGGSISCG